MTEERKKAANCTKNRAIERNSLATDAHRCSRKKHYGPLLPGKCLLWAASLQEVVHTLLRTLWVSGTRRGLVLFLVLLKDVDHFIMAELYGFFQRRVAPPERRKTWRIIKIGREVVVTLDVI